MSEAAESNNHLKTRPGSLKSPHWRPGRAMSATDPGRRAWVDPALTLETAHSDTAAGKPVTSQAESQPSAITIANHTTFGPAS